MCKSKRQSQGKQAIQIQNTKGKSQSQGRQAIQIQNTKGKSQNQGKQAINAKQKTKNCTKDRQSDDTLKNPTCVTISMLFLAIAAMHPATSKPSQSIKLFSRSACPTSRDCTTLFPLQILIRNSKEAANSSPRRRSVMTASAPP